jgi:hypothetical protein
MSSQKKEKNYKLFINNLDSWFSNFLIETFRTDHLPDFKNKYEISGNISNWKNDLPLYFTPSKIIDIDYDLSYNSDLFKNDIYIYNLNTGNINEIKYIINGLKENKFDNEKTFILISNIMTWAKTPVKIKDNENEDENYDERIYVEPIDEDEERERIRKEQEEKERKEREEKEREEKEKEEKEKEEKSKKKKKTVKEENENKEEEDKNLQNNEKEENNENNENDNNNNNNVIVEENENEIENKKYFVYYTENEYSKRIPSRKYYQYKYVENSLLNLNKIPNIKAYVICPGFIYGYGESNFYEIFKLAILNLPINKIIQKYFNNYIPTIHIKDIINIIKKIIDKKPENKYLLAFDNSKNKTLKWVIKSIYKCIGNINNMIEIEKTEKKIENNENENNENENKEEEENRSKKKKRTRKQIEEEALKEEQEKKRLEEERLKKEEEERIKKELEEKMKNQPIIFHNNFPSELLTFDIKILPSNFVSGEIIEEISDKNLNENSNEENNNNNNNSTPQLKLTKEPKFIPLFKWHCPNGINSNCKSIRKEFLKYRNLYQNKIYVLGSPYTGKTTISKILSKIFYLPLINENDIINYSNDLINNKIDSTNLNTNEERRNSIENDLIKDINKHYENIKNNLAEEEENYNKKKKKNDPPFNANDYLKLNTDLINRVFKRRALENDINIYGFILDGYPNNYEDAKDLFENNIQNNNEDIFPNSIVIFNEIDDEFLINRIKNSKEFPSDLKSPEAQNILETMNKRLNENKENKKEENYKSLLNYFEEFNEQNPLNKINIIKIDSNKEIYDLIKEIQEEIKKNNKNSINSITNYFNCNKYDYDYIKEIDEIRKEEERKKKEEEEEKKRKEEDEEMIKEGKDPKIEREKEENLKKQKEEEEKKNKEIENFKYANDREINEKIKEIFNKNDFENESHDNLLNILEKRFESKENTIISSINDPFKEEREKEFKLLEKKSEILRRYLAENVLPILTKGIIEICDNMPQDPVEYLSNFLLEATFERARLRELSKKNKENENNEENNENENNENNSSNLNNSENNDDVDNNKNENNEKKEDENNNNENNENLVRKTFSDENVHKSKKKDKNNKNNKIRFSIPNESSNNVI